MKFRRWTWTTAVSTTTMARVLWWGQCRVRPEIRILWSGRFHAGTEVEFHHRDRVNPKTYQLTTVHLHRSQRLHQENADLKYINRTYPMFQTDDREPLLLGIALKSAHQSGLHHPIINVSPLLSLIIKLIFREASKQTKWCGANTKSEHGRRSQ